MKSKHKFIYAKFSFAPHIIIIVLNCYICFSVIVPVQLYNSQVVEILPFYLPLPSSFSLFSLISFMRSINVTDEARRERIMPPKRSMASV